MYDVKNIIKQYILYVLTQILYFAGSWSTNVYKKLNESGFLMLLYFLSCVEILKALISLVCQIILVYLETIAIVIVRRLDLVNSHKIIFE